MNSGMNVRYDESFRSLLAHAREVDDFSGMLEFFEHQQMTIDNMDY